MYVEFLYWYKTITTRKSEDVSNFLYKMYHIRHWHDKTNRDILKLPNLRNTNVAKWLMHPLGLPDNKTTFDTS